MPDSPPITLLCFPPEDAAFERFARGCLDGLAAVGCPSPSLLQERLRPTFPHAVARAREELASLVPEVVWYVYRDGRYSLFAAEAWWREPDAMWVEIDASGRYVDASPSFLELTGLERDELLAMRTGDLADPGFRTIVPWIWDLLRDTGVLHSTSLMRTPEGRRLAVEYRLVKDAAGPGRSISYLRPVPLEVASPTTERSLEAAGATERA